MLRLNPAFPGFPVTVLALGLFALGASGCSGSSDSSGNDGVAVSFSGIDGGEPPRVEGGAGPALLDPDGLTQVGSADGSSFEGGRLIVSLNGTEQGSDVLGIVPEGSAAGEIDVVGSTISFEGADFATFTGGAAGADLEVLLGSGSSSAVIEALIGRLSFQNGDEDPLPPNRSLTLELRHPSGSSATVGVPLSIVPFALGQADTLSEVRQRLGTESPQEIISDGTHLVVSSFFGNRVLIWNQIPTSSTTPPDVVLGQPDFQTTTSNTGGVSASTFRHPVGLEISDGRLLVADVNNNRVLIWNTIPTTNGQPADVVVGQPDMFSRADNAGGPVSASSLWMPNGVHVAGDRLYVTDFSNNRVVVWNSVPTIDNVPADLVIGQPDMTSSAVNNGGISASTLNFPTGVVTVGDRLYVADYLNHRVLSFAATPVSNGAAADLVLGQPDMVSNLENNGGVSAASFFRPFFLDTTETQLLVSDFENDRILIWNSQPLVNRQPADVVVGQPDFSTGTANTGGVSAATLSTPVGVSTSTGRLFVGDRLNNRFLIWDEIPTANGASADLVLGQPDFTSTGANTGVTIDAMPTLLENPRAVTTDGTRLAVCDTDQNRVLIWNKAPTTFDQPADVVIGQPDMTTVLAGAAADGLTAPEGAVFVGDSLAIADTGNHRILLYSAVPTSNGAAADHVLGQPDIMTVTVNTGGVSGSSLNGPTGLGTDGTRLVACDTGNNRVLAWDTFPTTDSAAADRVVGQVDLSGSDANAGGLSDATLSAPSSVDARTDGLLVVDGGNSRGLAWNAFPTADGTSADVVLGQPDGTTSSANTGGRSAGTLDTPTGGVFTDSGPIRGIVIADTANNRISVWDVIPTTAGAAADSVIGQADMVTGSANAGGLRAASFAGPAGIAIAGGLLYVSDAENKRVLVRVFE